MRLVPLAIDLLDLCELLPCIGSGTVFQVPWAYYGCWDLVFEVFTLKMRFLHFWTDECSLKHARFAYACKTSRGQLCSLTCSFKRTFKRTVRLEVRLSDQPFWQHFFENCSCGPECWSGPFLAPLCNLNKPSNIRTLICIIRRSITHKGMSNISIPPKMSGPWEYDSIHVYVRVGHRF